MSPIVIGEKIAEFRKKNKLTQKELAEKLFVTDKAISKWERGTNYPDINKLEMISEVLGCSLTELLGIENESEETLVSTMIELSEIEVKNIAFEIIYRGIGISILGSIIFASDIIAFAMIIRMEIYGLIQGVTIGMLPFSGMIIGTGLYAVRKGWKLRKEKHLR